MDCKIAICLLTCNRPEVTRRTVQSMKNHIDLSKFILLHGDDNSDTYENHVIAQKAGFRTVIQTKKRAGVSVMWRNLVKSAKKAGADWVLMQENDWEWDRPLRTEELQDILSDNDVYYIRLFGKNKERSGRPCSKTHLGKNKTTDWVFYKDGWEIGDAHWGYPPNLTRIDEALFLSNVEKESDAQALSGQINKLCVRPKRNFVYHIGQTRTKGFLY